METNEREDQVTFARQRIAELQHLCQLRTFQRFIAALRRELDQVEGKIFDDPELTWEGFQQLRGQRRSLLDSINLPVMMMQAEIGNLSGLGEDVEDLRSDSLKAYLSAPS